MAKNTIRGKKGKSNREKTIHSKGAKQIVSNEAEKKTSKGGQKGGGKKQASTHHSQKKRKGCPALGKKRIKAKKKKDITLKPHQAKRWRKPERTQRKKVPIKLGKKKRWGCTPTY